MPSQEFEGKVALVTGGTSGIGRACAVALGKAGARVLVAGRREAAGAETVCQVQAAGGDARYIRLDVQEEASVAKLVEEAVWHEGGLDIAVNNAGVEHAGPLVSAEHEDFRRVFEVNVWGVLVCMKYEIPAMLKSGGGSIINLSSVAGQVGMAGVAIYVASKHAVEGLTKAAALEVASQGIRVNAVAPALIDTDMADRFAGKEGEQRAAITGMHPIGRSGKPEEVASAVCWLAGSGSSFVTGTTLAVDGGWLAR